MFTQRTEQKDVMSSSGRVWSHHIWDWSLTGLQLTDLRFTGSQNSSVMSIYLPPLRLCFCAVGLTIIRITWKPHSRLSPNLSEGCRTGQGRTRRSSTPGPLWIARNIGFWTGNLAEVRAVSAVLVYDASAYLVTFNLGCFNVFGFVTVFPWFRYPLLRVCLS